MYGPVRGRVRCSARYHHMLPPVAAWLPEKDGGERAKAERHRRLWSQSASAVSQHQRGARATRRCAGVGVLYVLYSKYIHVERGEQQHRGCDGSPSLSPALDCIEIHHGRLRWLTAPWHRDRPRCLPSRVATDAAPARAMMQQGDAMRPGGQPCLVRRDPWTRGGRTSLLLLLLI